MHLNNATIMFEVLKIILFIEAITLPDIKSDFIPVLSNMIILNWQLRLLDIIGQGMYIHLNHDMNNSL